MSATTVDVHEAQTRLLQLLALALKGNDVVIAPASATAPTPANPAMTNVATATAAAPDRAAARTPAPCGHRFQGARLKS